MNILISEELKELRKEMLSYPEELRLHNDKWSFRCIDIYKNNYVGQYFFTNLSLNFFEKIYIKNSIKKAFAKKITYTKATND